MTYDVTVRDSFAHVREWLQDVNKYAQEDTCKLLIGNKSDRTDRVVSREEGEELGKSLGVRVLPLSFTRVCAAHSSLVTHFNFHYPLPLDADAIFGNVCPH